MVKGKASVRVSEAEEELGRVYFVVVQDLPDKLSPVRFLIWRCPHCGAEIRAWTPSQLNAYIYSHKRKHER
jgi:ribosomal protein L37AE/L43A